MAGPIADLFSGGAQLADTVLTAARLLAFCVSLGLLTDLRTLRKAGHGWEQLRDDYDLRFLIGWGTAITAAIAAALAAAAQGAVSQLVTNVTRPASLSTPTPATTTTRLTRTAPPPSSGTAPTSAPSSGAAP
jgi:hypothetical protein